MYVYDFVHVIVEKPKRKPAISVPIRQRAYYEQHENKVYKNKQIIISLSLFVPISSAMYEAHKNETELEIDT